MYKIGELCVEFPGVLSVITCTLRKQTKMFVYITLHFKYEKEKYA